MISYVTNNWTIKLSAFLIAVALWSYTNGQVRVERSIEVHLKPEMVQQLPESYRVANIEPKVFSVRVSVPMSQASNVRSIISPKLVIEPDAPARGEQRIPITVSMLELTDDIRIERITPDSIRDIKVTMSLITEDYLPVEVPQLEGVPTGINATLAIEPTRVRVRGTREELAQMKESDVRVAYEPIVLNDVDPQMQKTRTEKVVLVAHNTQVQVIDTVTATITLSPGNTASREVAIPVQILAPRDFHERFSLELSQPQIVLSVHGPDSLLQALQPETELTAYVVMRSTIEPGVPIETTVGVLGPAWMSYDPITIRVTATLKAARLAPEREPGAVTSP